MKTTTETNRFKIQITKVNMSIEEMKSELVDETNFHDCTIANFIEKDIEFVADFKSGSGSEYMFTSEGVYRRSNHWLNTVNTCIWLLDGKESSKDTIAFCSFENFKKYSSKRDSKNRLSNDYKIYQDSIIDMLSGEMILSNRLGKIYF